MSSTVDTTENTTSTTSESPSKDSLEEKKARALKLRRLKLQQKIKEKINAALDLSNKSNKSRFEIKQWNAISLWTYEKVSSDVCAICKESLYAPCVECHANTPDFNPFSDEAQKDEKIKKMCSVAFGKCNHTFHWHCIDKWLGMASVHAAKCPVCGSQFEMKSKDFLFKV
mmetsp:Transcript_5601/g.21074  ORF Transcript_5601/g.21074 Transcript_5601/m.21074 type:complete len:170 (-) Transcript_5601:1303-1812(-)